MSLVVNGNSRDRGGWTKQSEAYLERVHTILTDLKEYWPMTLRQVYYQLVAAGHIPNKPAEYGKLSRILSKARLDGLVSWDAIEDRTRSLLNSANWCDKSQFIERELTLFLTGYQRNLIQDQPYALEVWTEKDALSQIIYGVAAEYCVPVIVAKGFSSVSFVHECRKRVLRNYEKDQTTLILYFGDLDPSGWYMLPTMMTTLQDEMGLEEYVEGKRYALMPKQVDKYNLLRNPDALKPTDTRAKKYMAEFGDLAVELDALQPATLQAIVRRAIEENLDLSQFEEDQRTQTEELKGIIKLKKKVTKHVKESFDEL